MRGKKSGMQADACAVVEPTEWQKTRMTRDERLYAALLEPASAVRFEGRPDFAHWYCVSLKGGTEFGVERKLSRAGVEAFVLREKEDIVKKGAVIEVEKPVFKGYIFVRILPLADAFYALKQLEEVRGFLGDGTRYNVIPDGHIAVFKRVFEKVDTKRMPVDKTIGQGQRAHITHGTFTGHNCIVLQVKSGRNPRVRVCVEGFGDFARDVTLDLAYLRKL